MKNGYIMDKRIVLKSEKGTYDFKRMGEVTIRGTEFDTKKYVNLVYPKLPDAIKEHATLIKYDDQNMKYRNQRISVVDVNDYMEENKLD